MLPDAVFPNPCLSCKEVIFNKLVCLLFNLYFYFLNLTFIFIDSKAKEFNEYVYFNVVIKEKIY